MKRPPSVWLVQALLSVVCVVALPSFLAWTVAVFSRLFGSTRPPIEVGLFYAEFVLKLGLLSFLAVTVWALGRRWRKSRRLPAGGFHDSST